MEQSIHQITSELFTSSESDRTAIVDTPAFTIDFYRCGKCSSEFDTLDDLIFHKIIVEKNNLVLWESEKIKGIQIPRFLESGVNFFVSHESRPSNIKDEANWSLLPKPCTTKAVIEDKVPPTNKQVQPKESILQQPIQRIIATHDTRDKNAQKTFVEDTSQTQNNSVFNYASNGPKRPKDVELPNSLKKSIATRPAHQSLFQQLPADEPSVKDFISIDNDRPKCKICKNSYRDISVLKTHIATVHSLQRPFLCKYTDCPSSFKTKASMQRHVRRHTDERPFKCERCNRSFRESGTLARHTKARVSCEQKGDADLPRYGKTVQLPMKSTKNVSSPHTTTVSCEPPHTLQIIITQVPEETIETSGQQEQLTISQVDIQHTTIPDGVGSHPDFAKLLEAATQLEPLQETITEPTVINTFPQSEEIKASVIQQMTEQSFHCILCQESFFDTQPLSKHLQLHVKGLPFRCTKCYYICSNVANLQMHVKTAHGRLLPGMQSSTLTEYEEESGEAQVAAAQLIFLHDLLDAQNQKRAEEEPVRTRNRGVHRCHVCLKRFCSKQYFNLHMGTHTGKQPYVCDVCNRTFICKDFLQKHLISHSEERLFQCSICSRSFKRASHVREHFRTHTEEKTFFCKICGRGFKWHGGLKSHEITHSRKCLFLCDTCGKRFRAKSSLMRHTRLHWQSPRQPDPGHTEVQDVGASLSEETTVSPQEQQQFIQQETAVVPGPAYLFLVTAPDGNTCYIPAQLQENEEEEQLVQTVNTWE